MRYYLPHSTSCFVCGQDNSKGLKCRFYADEKGTVHLDPVVPQVYAGFAQVVHGGIQTAMLDEAMGWCAFTQSDSECLCFTRELNVKFRKNVVPMTEVHIICDLKDIKRGMFHVEGRIEDSAGVLLTQASGVFIPIPEEIMKQVNNQLYYVNDGRQYLEKAMRVINPNPGRVE